MLISDTTYLSLKHIFIKQGFNINPFVFLVRTAIYHPKSSAQLNTAYPCPVMIYSVLLLDYIHTTIPYVSFLIYSIPSTNIFILAFSLISTEKPSIYQTPIYVKTFPRHYHDQHCFISYFNQRYSAISTIVLNASGFQAMS